MLVLNAPASPLSLVATTIRRTWSRPVPASSLGVCGPTVSCDARLATTASIRCAYGRPASAASCARRSFAAATIFIALVIFWVDLTDPILLFRALRLAISFLHVLPRRRKHGLGYPHRRNACLFKQTSRRKRRARPCASHGCR